MNFIAKKIYETRKAKGLTQEELAELSKVNIRTIQRIENNESEPRGKTLNLICDALQMEPSELSTFENDRTTEIAFKIANGFFLVVLNLALIGIIGFLTLDSNANTNSRFGGVLISVFLPMLIVFLTKKMSGLERVFKFGLGYVAYFFLVLFLHGFPVGFITGLFPSLLLSISVLFFGQNLIEVKRG